MIIWNYGKFDGPKLEPVGDSYQLVEDWKTDCEKLLAAEITVPKGFKTDGASIPRFLWTLCGSPMDIPRVLAAVVYDYLYTIIVKIPLDDDGNSVDCTRQMADMLYRDYQIALGISKFKAYTEYCFLRIFGSSHWQTQNMKK